MTTRRHLSWRARQGSQRFKEGSRKAAVTCWGDFINPRLVPIKITFFIIMGATQVVAPYHTLLLRALGLTVQEAGFIYTIGPLIPIVAPFMAGLIADKVGNFRAILVITVALSGFTSLMKLGIPPARTTPKYSDTLSLDVTCGAANFILTPSQPKKPLADCIFHNGTVIAPNIDAKNCGYQCLEPAVDYPMQLLKKVKKVQVVQTINHTLYHVCELQYLKNIQKCFRVNLNESLKHENMPSSFQIHNLVLHLSSMDPENPFLVVDNFTMSSDDLRKFECTEGHVPKSIEIPKIVMAEGTPNLEAALGSVECHFHCEATVPHNLTCEEQLLSIEHNVALSFWLFVTAHVLSAFLIGLTYTLFEVAVVAILKEFGHDYGFQRIYGSIGGMVFAPLSGFFIDHFGKGGHYTDYYAMFIFYCAMKIICAIILMRIDLRFKVPARSMCSNISNLFSNIEVILLIGIVFISGMLYGFIENFLSWYLLDLGATNWFIGLMTTVASVAAVPFLGLSGIICKKFGHIQSISFGLVCYSIRCIGYSMIQTYYWCALFETLEGITTGLLVASAIIYASHLSTNTNVATLQGILATFHYGFGKAAGSLLGGFLMSKLNARYSFQVFSCIALVSGFSYYLVGKLVILPRHARRLKQQQEIMAMPITTISRRDHKRMTAMTSPIATSTVRRDDARKGDGLLHESSMSDEESRIHESPKLTRENAEIHAEENGVLDETQMTDLPPDDTMVSLDETFIDSEDKQTK